MKFNRITKDNIYQMAGHQKTRWQQDYLSMYSSQWHGFTTDPDLMHVPLDDHLVHRGDGVFEVMRSIGGKVYQMDAHLQRLNRSATAIALDLPPDYREIKEIVSELISLTPHKDCVIRIIVSRGPGSFNVNPFDCPSSHLYVNTMRFREIPREYYSKGVSLITSSIPVKNTFFANIKSCNYLPNVLMKMEALNKGADFPVSIDENGYIAEGATENIGILTKDNVLKFPSTHRTLSGITAKAVLSLSMNLVEKGMIKEAKHTNITPEDAYRAKEIFLTGTSIEVLPVVSYDNNIINNGLPGPVSAELLRLLRDDMIYNTQSPADRS